jgi:hypothetical protein
MSVEISLLLYSISLKLRNFWGKQREINRGDLASASKAGHKQTLKTFVQSLTLGNSQPYKRLPLANHTLIRIGLVWISRIYVTRYFHREREMARSLR